MSDTNAKPLEKKGLVPEDQILDTPNAFNLSDTDIENIQARIESSDQKDIQEIFENELSFADQADLLAKISSDERDHVVENYAQYIDPLAFLELDDDLRRETLQKLDAANIAELIRDLDSDDALDLILPFEHEKQTEIIKHLSAKTRLALEEGLSFPEDSAGRLMQREFVAVPAFWTVGKTIDYLRAAGDELPSEFFEIVVVTPTYHVTGEITLDNLLRSQRKVKLDDLTLDELHTIPATMDQEEVARIFQRENLVSAPVIDDEGRLIGMITFDDIIDVIQEEASEDILRMAGVDQGDLYKAILETTRSRFGWLFINLLTAIMASIVISFFGATIEKIVALAILMPIVASMGGNAGTQALTVAVRAIATKELSSTNAIRVVWKETFVGFLNGVAFALICGVVTTLWFDDMVLGAVIAAAMIINLVAAGLFGAIIPITIDKMGKDPALASTVLLTTVTDIIGFIAFLGLAALFLL